MIDIDEVKRRLYLERTPEGTRLAYLLPSGMVVILGSPASDDESHNCDAFGCGQLHVVEIYRAVALDALAIARAEALEEAARVAEHPRWRLIHAPDEIAARIRSLASSSPATPNGGK